MMKVNEVVVWVYGEQNGVKLEQRVIVPAAELDANVTVHAPISREWDREIVVKSRDIKPQGGPWPGAEITRALGG